MRARSSLLVLATVALTGCADAVPEAPCPGVIVADGSCRLECASDTDCLLSERCEGGACLVLGAPRPAILSFEGPAGAVRPGSLTELRFRTAFATTVRLGLEGTDGAVLDAAEGVEQVGPLQETGVWVLVAESPSGRVEARARVEVDDVVRPEVQIVDFEVAPNRVSPGATVRLTWEVENPEGPIRVVAGDDVVVADGQPVGEAEWRVEETTAFALSAPGFPRPALASETVVVDSVDPGAILSFSAIPNGATSPLFRPRGVLLRWETDGGAALELTENGQGLTTVTTPAALARGAWLVAPAAGSDTVYAARLADGSAAPPEREVRVQVASEVAPPVIARFELTPDRLPDSGSGTVALRWEVTGASPQVRLEGPNGSIIVPQQGQRTVSVSTERSAVFRLRAETPGGLVEARRVAWRLVDEDEPNDRPDDALELERVGAEGIVRTFGAVGDSDWFAVEAEEDGRLEARLLPPCERGLRLAVFDRNMMSPLGEETALGGSCPGVVVSPSRGSYLLRVDRPGLELRAEYAVVADAVGPTCGDGVRSGEEACDDGNRAPGDGCSQACTLEPGWTYRAERRDVEIQNLPAGTRLALVPYVPGGDARDEGLAVVDLETWTFPFFGEAHAGFAVHANGFISFFPDHADPNAEAGPAAFGPQPPNAWIAPFMGDLRLTQAGRIAVERGQEDGEAAVRIIFEGLEAKSAPGSRLGAQVTLLRSGEVRMSYPPGSASGGDAAELAAGLESPRGAVRIAPRGCGRTACALSDLVGATHVFR